VVCGGFELFCSSFQNASFTIVWHDAGCSYQVTPPSACITLCHCTHPYIVFSAKALDLPFVHGTLPFVPVCNVPCQHFRSNGSSGNGSGSGSGSFAKPHGILIGTIGGN
jgi:hypothetical protein